MIMSKNLPPLRPKLESLSKREYPQSEYSSKRGYPPRLAEASHPSRGELKEKLWNPKSLYPYWEIPRNKSLTERAKELRKAGNLSEVLFWQKFKDKNKLGFDIDRQVIIGNYIVDFFIPELGLVFEIDGGSHTDKVEYDFERGSYMQDLNLQIVRISDVDVKKRMGGVYQLVLEMVEKRKFALKFPS
jgi:very-short-patch-repair endonuclease